MHRYCYHSLKLAFILVKSKWGSPGVAQCVICRSSCTLPCCWNPSPTLEPQINQLKRAHSIASQWNVFTMKCLSMVRTSGNSLRTASGLELSIWSRIILSGRFGLGLNSAFCQLGKSTCGWMSCGVCGLQMYVLLHPSLLTHPALSSSLGRHLQS